VGTLRFFSDGKQEWSSPGEIAVQGYHSLARNNPFRQEVLFVGGCDPNVFSFVQRQPAIEL
jgi:hypothetical protein